MGMLLLLRLVEEAEVVAAVGEGWRRHRSRCGRGGGRGLEEAGAVAAVAVGEGCYTAHASQRRGHCGRENIVLVSRKKFNGILRALAVPPFSLCTLSTYCRVP